ncbi:MAG: hypothetical protein AAGE93_17705 [Bacteroidota bacterium]
MPFKFIFTTLIASLPIVSCAQKVNNELVYLKQLPPGLTPEVFAPGFISQKDEFEFGSVFSEDGTEFYYGVDVNGKSETRYTKLKDGQWTEPIKLFHHEQYGYNDPFLSPDEQQLYFISSQPLDGTGAKKDIDIWYAEKQTNGWSEPINPGEIINSDSNEYYISFTESGTLYFASNIRATQRGDYDIYASHQVNGQFQAPQRLSDAVNTVNYEADVFVAYDESYLIFCSHRPGSFGRGDLYISFKQEDGSWTQAKNMGNAINTKNYEFCPFVTKDGKYFFYSSDRDIYWVSAKIIEQLRSND